MRIAGLNLLAAITICWNTAHFGRAIAQCKRAGFNTPEEPLANTSPFGWAHIVLTGEYRWHNLVAARG